MQKIHGLARCLLCAAFFASSHAAAGNPIQTENAKVGTTEWKPAKPGYASQVIEGFASAASVNVAGSIKLFVNTKEPSYAIDIFRTGYYGGTGARRMLPTISRTGIAQPPCPMDPATGLIECNWINPYVLGIPGDWVSGFYIAKLTSGSTGTNQYILFVVRDDLRFSDVLMISATNTYQAYNVWGGKSLYGTIADRDDTANKAVKVSYNRPYYGDETYGTGNFFGSALKRMGWEQARSYWLEKNGYDVTYATDVDVDGSANVLLSHRMVNIVGHSEYWSWAAVDNIERAMDAGISLFLTSGNNIYWQIRYEPSTIDGTPSRNIVGYKELIAQDPLRNTQYATTLFRKSPVNRSEDIIIGNRFVTQAQTKFCVEDASSWVFTNTGLHNGDCIANPDGSLFVGYEVDAMGPFTPAGVQRFSHSPATSRYAIFSDGITYRLPSGATLVNTGSIGWSIDQPAIVQLTTNVLARMINGAFADTTPVRPPLPSPFRTLDIGNVGRPGFVALAGNDSFTLNGGGNANTFAGTDAQYFVYQQLSGDGSITARVLSCQNFWDNRCGIQIRENLTPGSRSVALLSTPSESSGSVVEGAEFRVKSIVSGHQDKLVTFNQRQPNWLKLVRSGNTFNASMSADGMTWTTVGSTSLALSANAYIGAVIQGAQNKVWATGRFDQVSVSGGSAPTGDLTKPSVSLTAPANGSTVSGTIDLSAIASDDVAVAGVQFEVDGSTIGPEDTSSPYSGSLNTTTLSNGTHTISATARDAAGNSATSLVSVSVSNGAPPVCTVSFSPTSIYVGQSSAKWTIAVTASSPTCQWTVSTSDSWLAIKDPVTLTYAVPGVQVSFTGSVSMTVHTLTGIGTVRTGSFTIAGKAYSVKQGF